MARLYKVVPMAARHHSTVNGAGGRALGASGRSLHNVLQVYRAFWSTS